MLNTNMVNVRSDKTSNLYYASPQLYKKLIINNSTIEYLIKLNDPTMKINKEATQILSNYKSKNRNIPKLTLNHYKQKGSALYHKEHF